MNKSTDFDIIILSAESEFSAYFKIKKIIENEKLSQMTNNLNIIVHSLYTCEQYDNIISSCESSLISFEKKYFSYFEERKSDIHEIEQIEIPIKYYMLRLYLILIECYFNKNMPDSAKDGINRLINLDYPYPKETINALCFPVFCQETMRHLFYHHKNNFYFESSELNTLLHVGIEKFPLKFTNVFNEYPDMENEINEENEKGFTPLHLAMIKNRNEIVDFLLKKNAALKEISYLSYKLTCIEFAIYKRKFVILKRIVQKMHESKQLIFIDEDSEDYGYLQFLFFKFQEEHCQLAHHYNNNIDFLALSQIIDKIKNNKTDAQDKILTQYRLDEKIFEYLLIRGLSYHYRYKSALIYFNNRADIIQSTKNIKNIFKTKEVLQLRLLFDHGTAIYKDFTFEDVRYFNLNIPCVLFSYIPAFLSKLDNKINNDSRLRKMFIINSDDFATLLTNNRYQARSALIAFTWFMFSLRIELHKQIIEKCSQLYLKIYLQFCKQLPSLRYFAAQAFFRHYKEISTCYAEKENINLDPPEKVYFIFPDNCIWDSIHPTKLVNDLHETNTSEQNVKNENKKTKII